MRTGGKFDHFQFHVIQGVIRIWWWDKYGQHQDKRLEAGERVYLLAEVQNYGPVEAHTEANVAGEPAEIWVYDQRLMQVKDGGLTTLVKKFEDS